MLVKKYQICFMLECELFNILRKGRKLNPHMGYLFACKTKFQFSSTPIFLPYYLNFYQSACADISIKHNLLKGGSDFVFVVKGYTCCWRLVLTGVPSLHCCCL